MSHENGTVCYFSEFEVKYLLALLEQDERSGGHTGPRDQYIRRANRIKSKLTAEPEAKDPQSSVPQYTQYTATQVGFINESCMVSERILQAENHNVYQAQVKRMAAAARHEADLKEKRDMEKNLAHVKGVR